MMLDANNVAVTFEVEEGNFREPSLVVRVTAAGSLRANVDRPEIHGWGLGNPLKQKTMDLAIRLRRAILAGAAFAPDAAIRRDIYGNTYVDSTQRIFGRTMLRDLRRLGF